MTDFSYFAGHDSFYLRDGWLYKGVSELEKNPELFASSNLISAVDALGVGANMVKSIRYWLDFCGLVEKSSTKHQSVYTLSNLALAIQNNDTYFQSPISLWLLHNEMAKKSIIWNVLFVDNGLQSFTKEQARQLMSIRIQEANVQYSSSTISSSVDVFLNTYAWDRQLKRKKDPEDNLLSPLNRLKLLQTQGERYFFRTISENEISPFFIYYMLFDENRREYSMDDAFAYIRKNISIDLNGLRIIFANLEQKKFISIDRAARLNMIYDQKELPTDRKIHLIYKESK